MLVWVRPRSNVILKVDTIFDSMSNIMYSLICPLLWQYTPSIKEPVKTIEPLRIRIPRFVICTGCEKEKILKKAKEIKKKIKENSK
jgi:hypothetical protein